MSEDHPADASRVATRRLLDASATLDGADRALLNIWINRGLDDVALARMTGLGEAAVAARRTGIVAHLSATLGLPPETVRSALDEIAAPPQAAAPAPEPAPSPAPSANGSPPPDQTPAPSRSRRSAWWAAAALAALVVIVLIVSLASGGSARHSRRSAPRTTPVTTTTAPPGAPATVPRSSGDPLVALPGGPAHATGAVAVTGTRPSLKLNLSVSGLPAPANGHYEIWLYDSIIYARGLGRLPAGVSHVVVTLPANASRFRWIDISFQPTGAVFHSGESLLRAANPLFKKARAG